MRRRRSARGKKKQNDSAGVASIVLLLVVVALFIYVFQALDIGSILFGDGTASPSPSASKASVGVTLAPTPSPSHSVSASATAAATTVSGSGTEEIKLNPITLYGVQLGVFNQEENARALADQMKPSGASGYILRDGDQFRVVDSVYYGQADAKTVRDQYKNSSATDASLLKVEVSGITWRVTATKEQIATIRSALLVMQSQIVVLIDTQKKAQARQGSPEDYLSVISASARKFTETDDALTQALGNTSTPQIVKLHEALTESANNLNALVQAGGGNPTALLSGLKYNIIEILLKLEQKLKST